MCVLKLKWTHVKKVGYFWQLLGAGGSELRDFLFCNFTQLSHPHIPTSALRVKFLVIIFWFAFHLGQTTIQRRWRIAIFGGTARTAKSDRTKERTRGFGTSSSVLCALFSATGKNRCKRSSTVRWRVWTTVSALSTDWSHDRVCRRKLFTRRRRSGLGSVKIIIAIKSKMPFLALLLIVVQRECTNSFYFISRILRMAPRAQAQDAKCAENQAGTETL